LEVNEEEEEEEWGEDGEDYEDGEWEDEDGEDDEEDLDENAHLINEEDALLEDVLAGKSEAGFHDEEGDNLLFKAGPSISKKGRGVVIQSGEYKDNLMAPSNGFMARVS
jgi:hypothetical protein